MSKTHKVITGADGRLKTVEVSTTDAEAAVAKTRRELRDMLAGNTPFHTDTLGPGPKQPDPEVTEVFDPSGYMGYGY